MSPGGAPPGGRDTGPGAEPLPPGQVATRLLPRVGEREPEPFDEAAWTLTVDGCVHEPLVVPWREWPSLPRAERRGTIHCVTRWSRPGAAFAGVALAALLEHARPRRAARFVRFASGRGHDTTLPLSLAREDVLLADTLCLDGGPPLPLPGEHGGPVRSLCLSRYFYKSVKWLRRVELLAEDRLGSWERSAGYHNAADPWREERYVASGIDRATLARLLDVRDLAGHDLHGADLSGADLSGFSLESTNLRAAGLRGASMRGADLRGASLCNADLRDADVSQALIDGLDLDGADLAGADLRGAAGVPASLAAVQLGGESEDRPPCRVEGLDWRGADVEGLLAAAAAFLSLAGVIDPLPDPGE